MHDFGQDFKPAAIIGVTAKQFSKFSISRSGAGAAENYSLFALPKSPIAGGLLLTKYVCQKWDCISTISNSTPDAPVSSFWTYD